MRIRLSMAESQKRMRTSSGGGGGSRSPSNTTAAVKKEQVSSAQRRPLVPGGGGGPAAVNQAADTTVAVVVVDKDLWLHCSGCSAALKPPIYKCEAAGHKVCSACRGSNPCRACGSNNGAAAAYTRCSGDDLDGLMRALCVPCPYKAYSGCGCRGLVPYISVDVHRLCCLNPPCSCSVFPCSGGGDGFLGSPRALHDHLAGPVHSWPTTEIYTDSRVKGPAARPHIDGPQSRRLLFCKDDGCVFVLLAAAGGAGELTAVAHCQDANEYRLLPKFSSALKTNQQRRRFS
ncbi:uncharacterized protein LOC106866778 [Brachypodium distachyon]|uniref:RING-type E3 ubiquitin transferase n=1 Tax=Brachypodium distachyon TaxID=15368 RepID=A0A0Q3HG74_BRADI|nr:uncharacterized protein LOC106866778 [Brachypodium distachyon]KQJ87411.1 hypothetical protein BRADI_4g10961v3 [Brachypodium distachyon]PNT63056.1 hypothetical protein BRADI_4g10961v3 [Brachypodium distachyon]|eukprot:XP_014758066.1 uncharacterized protein LOC106866778 [Brachypodium distachyon]